MHGLSPGAEKDDTQEQNNKNEQQHGAQTDRKGLHTGSHTTTMRAFSRVS